MNRGRRYQSGYNHEARKGTPYFFCLDRQQEGAVPLVMWYSYWPDNCILVAGTGNPPGVNTGCGRGKYYKCYTLGYIFTNLSDAQEYGDDAVPLYHYRYGSYSASKGKDIDDFYTINPAGEINLEDNPIPCRKPWIVNTSIRVSWVCLPCRCPWSASGDRYRRW